MSFIEKIRHDMILYTALDMQFGDGKGNIEVEVEPLADFVSNREQLARRETATEILAYLDTAFSEGHGGGNWRRLIDLAKAHIKVKYQ